MSTFVVMISGLVEGALMVMVPTLLVFFLWYLCSCWHRKGDPARRPAVVLPDFPYAQGGDLEEAPDCGICLEPLRQGQLCSEVPVCRHVFHRDCIGAWVWSNASCPLCRAVILPGSSGGVAVADDMV